MRPGTTGALVGISRSDVSLPTQGHNEFVQPFRLRSRSVLSSAGFPAISGR